MIKNIFIILLFVSSFATAQHTVKGTMSPKPKTDWVILYQLEGTKQVFIGNTNIKSDSIKIGGVNKEVGTFEIKIPKNAKSGFYRANYRLEGTTFVDFFYNKEDVSFIFNPDYPEQTIAFQKSTENKLYRKYLDDITTAQQKIDSIQIAVLKNNSLNLSLQYKKALETLNSIQNYYLSNSDKKYIFPFIKANLRYNSSEILTSVNEYMSILKNKYFINLDFTNTSLINSSFLTNKILDYVFYINFSENKEAQQLLYKESIVTVLSKIKNETYKKNIIEFLINQFEISKNLEIIDYLFEDHYNKLPTNIQNKSFKKEKMDLFAAEISRIAPDFSWKENGINLKLSTLNDAEKYILVFWSTSCSHCLREIPQLHTYTKDKKNIKVIAFALENDSYVWKQYSKTNLKDWHNVLGLNKWENKTARTYQVNATPSYFILDNNKKIIAKPNEIKDVKEFIENLKM